MKNKLLLSALVEIIVVLYPGTAEAVIQDVVFYHDAVVESDEYYKLVTVYDTPPDDL